MGLEGDSLCIQHSAHHYATGYQTGYAIGTPWGDPSAWAGIFGDIEGDDARDPNDGATHSLPSHHYQCGSYTAYVAGGHWSGSYHPYDGGEHTYNPGIYQTCIEDHNDPYHTYGALSDQASHHPYYSSVDPKLYGVGGTTDRPTGDGAFIGENTYHIAVPYYGAPHSPPS